MMGLNKLILLCMVRNMLQQWAVTPELLMPLKVQANLYVLVHLCITQPTRAQAGRQHHQCLQVQAMVMLHCLPLVAEYYIHQAAAPACITQPTMAVAGKKSQASTLVQDLFLIMKLTTGFLYTIKMMVIYIIQRMAHPFQKALIPVALMVLCM